MTGSRVPLPDVTVCAVDTANVALAARAIERSAARCAFGDAVLCTDRAVPGSFRVARIGTLQSRADYSRFVLKHLLDIVHTSFVLIVQWDGFVVDEAAWDAAFLAHDYIGATWPWYTDGHDVGNGGFSLRSRRLLSALADPRFVVRPDVAEDDYICRLFRPVLEAQYGIRFAPAALADRFSYERATPEAPTFGFHGLFNAWRHLDDGELIEFSRALGPYVIRTREFAELVGHCFGLGRRAALGALYGRLRAGRPAGEVAAQLAAAWQDERFVEACMRAGDEACRGEA